MRYKIFRISLLILTILLFVGCLQTQGFSSISSDYPHEPVAEMRSDPIDYQIPFDGDEKSEEELQAGSVIEPVTQTNKETLDDSLLGTSSVNTENLSSKEEGFTFIPESINSEENRSESIIERQVIPNNISLSIENDDIQTNQTSINELQNSISTIPNIESHEGSPSMEILVLLSILLVVALIGLIASRVMLGKNNRTISDKNRSISILNQRIEEYELEINERLNAIKYLQERIETLKIDSIEDANNRLTTLHNQIEEIEMDLVILGAQKVDLTGEKNNLEEQCEKLDARVHRQKLRISRSKELYTAIEHAVKRFHVTDIPAQYYLPLEKEIIAELDNFAPTVMLNLNNLNYKDLRKEFRENQKQIDSLLEVYAQRYTTKANQAIYKLMVLSLRSELQNILYNLKFEKLENAKTQVRSLVSKYLLVSAEGNQAIAGTMRKFIGELEHLFENAVRIEYDYYIKREQARQEQLALRQQMREEAEERKRLEEQKKQIAFEEEKYHSEIAKVEAMLEEDGLDEARRDEIQSKLEELHHHLNSVEEQKEEITKLQNGKAGNVYIISNLGSFGDAVFKIGMTRRLDPQDRVNELGSASVPFKFDVHSFIFSEDAVGLENELHRRLHSRRVNKVNLRKEFFNVSLDELEEMVMDVNPTAEFNRTMLAEDYNQSISLAEEGINLPELEISSIEDDDELEENESSSE